MSTDLNLLGKGLKRLGVLVLLFILSPVSLTIGYKALNKYTESPQNFIAYGILFISFLLIIFTLFFAFKTFKILMNSLFNK